MLKNNLLLTLIIGLAACNTNSDVVDYFGQTKPDTVPIVFAQGRISQKGRLEYGISFTPDSPELAFGILNKGDFRGEIYYSKKVDNKWSEPNVFKPLENKSVFLPYFSPDGKSLVFTQSKWDTAFHYKEIWIIERNDKSWNNPEKLKVPSQSYASVSNACMALDGTLFFSSNINCLGRDNCHTADLFYSELANNKYQKEKVIPEFISANDEESVFISPKQDYILFCRFTDIETWMDLYISYRDIHNNWIKPQIIDAGINSKDWDRRPFVSIDQRFLFFTRSQIDENSTMIESDIYWVNTTKLFKPFVYNPLSDTALQVGEKFKLSIPINYFKDLDDKHLTISIHKNKLDWVEFDKDEMILSGIPTVKGNFELTIAAVDQHSNLAEDKIQITVID